MARTTRGNRAGLAFPARSRKRCSASRKSVWRASIHSNLPVQKPATRRHRPTRRIIRSATFATRLGFETRRSFMPTPTSITRSSLMVAISFLLASLPAQPQTPKPAAPPVRTRSNSTPHQPPCWQQVGIPKAAIEQRRPLSKVLTRKSSPFAPTHPSLRNRGIRRSRKSASRPISKSTPSSQPSSRKN